MNANTPITALKGVGEKTAKLFQKVDIASVGDLLTFFPRDYESFLEPVTIEVAKPGEVCAIYASVISVPNVKKVRNLTVVNVNIRDESGSMQLTFFNMPFLKNVLKLILVLV